MDWYCLFAGLQEIFKEVAYAPDYLYWNCGHRFFISNMSFELDPTFFKIETKKFF